MAIKARKKSSAVSTPLLKGVGPKPKKQFPAEDTPWEDFEELDEDNNIFKISSLSKEATSEVIAANLGQRIRNAMANLEIDQTDLAERIGYTRTNINKVIMGRHNPSLPLLVKLADALGVTVDYLLGRNISQSELNQQLIDMQGIEYSRSLLINIVTRILTDSRIEKIMVSQKKGATSKSVLEGIQAIIYDFRKARGLPVEAASGDVENEV